MTVRVLIADDSPTVRELLTIICRHDPGLEVIGQAADGVEAVDLTLALHPDIVVMDVHMPHMDGFTATRRIMQEHPTPVLIVTATVRPDDVSLAMRSIEAGAVSVVQKPSGLDDRSQAHGVASFRRKVRALAGVRVIRRYEPRPLRQRRHAALATRASVAVGVAASTGGPLALRDLLAPLPVGFPAPVAVVQHIAAGFLSGFASWLGSGIQLPVKIAEHDEPFAAGGVYLAPDLHHLAISRTRRVRLETGPPRGGFRPSGSALFSSLAEIYGPAAVGVILTGLGDDGLAGLRDLDEAGGCVLAQDPDSAVAPSMPASVVRASVADSVAPVDVLANQLIALCGTTEGDPP